MLSQQVLPTSVLFLSCVWAWWSRGLARYEQTAFDRCAPLPRGRYEPQAKLPYIVRLLRTVFVAAYAYVNGAEARASLVLALAS